MVKFANVDAISSIHCQPQLLILLPHSVVEVK